MSKVRVGTFYNDDSVNDIVYVCKYMPLLGVHDIVYKCCFHGCEKTHIS